MIDSYIITLCLESIGMDHVFSELCYKWTILQRNYCKMAISCFNALICAAVMTTALTFYILMNFIQQTWNVPLYKSRGHRL